MTGVFLVGLLLLATARASEVSLHTVQEDNKPGSSSGTYAIVQDGRLIGVVRRYQASALGRRAGPFAFADDTLPADARPVPTGGIVDILRSRLDLVNAVQDQLQASRCPYARQMMLAQLQAAAAAQAFQADVDELESDAGLVETRHKMFGGVEGMPRKQPVDGILRGRHGPFPEMTMHEAEHMVHRGPHFAEHARQPFMIPRVHEPRGEGPHELDVMPAEQPMNFGHGPLFLRNRDAADAGPGPHPFARPMMLMRGPHGGWAELENTAEPAPEAEPELNWQLWNEDATLNWGLLTFVGLVAACATVWGVMVLHCCAFARCSVQSSPRSCFITSSGSGNAAALQPLLREGHVEGLPAKGVESAAAHVPASQQNVTVLHYEPLKM